MQEIPLTRQLNSFKHHLDANERVIFSAKFGDGKTFFLNKFKEEYKEDYFFITLYPINYSVAENADIFEYIKRDIILQLAEKDILCNIDFEAIADTLFSWENAKEVISFLLSSLPSGVFYEKVLKKIDSFYSKYQEKKATYLKYLESFNIQKGSIYENDAYTQLIGSAIKYIQRSQKAVLIIEDLDRIDPAHLFRILNILGSHIDCIYQPNSDCPPNKFGFNNIITVFDFEVTKNIFQHFYSEKANYEGYINKFKSHNPFCFSINETAKQFLRTFLEEKCKTSYETLNRRGSIPFHVFYNKISVREVCNILDGIENQIIYEKIKALNLQCYFSSISPLTLLLAVYVRLGVPKDIIAPQLRASIQGLELLNLIGTYMLTDSWICTQSLLRWSSECFKINIIQEDDLATTVTFTQYNGPIGFHNQHPDISAAIDNAIKIALCQIKN